MVVEPEIVASEPAPESPRVRLMQVQGVGFLGALLAVLTMFAAFGVGFLALFGTTLASAALVALLWPAVFSPQFTQWVFGSPRVEFWKLFLLFLAAGAVVKLFRRQLWQRR